MEIQFDPTFLFNVCCLALVAIGIGLAVWWMRKRASQRQALLTPLGFTKAAPEALSLLQNRLEMLFPGLDARAGPVYHRRFSDGDQYVCDINTHSGSSSTTIGTDTVTLISPALNAPPVLITPRFAAEGIAAMAGEAFAFLTRSLASRVGVWLTDFPGYQRFAQKYDVYAGDQARAREFLTDDRIDELVEMEHGYEIYVREDTLLVIERIPAQGPTEMQRVEATIHAAQAIFEMLRPQE